MREIIDWKRKGRSECEKLYQQYELQSATTELEEIKAKRCRT